MSFRSLTTVTGIPAAFAIMALLIGCTGNQSMVPSAGVAPSQAHQVIPMRLLTPPPYLGPNCRHCWTPPPYVRHRPAATKRGGPPPHLLTPPPY